MQFGHFDDAHREYVITDPKTPLPWINYLGSEAFFSLISNTAGGYSFYKDAKLRRITRYRYNNIPTDSNGRYFFTSRMAIPSGIQAGSPPRRNWTNIPAVTAWAIRSSMVRKTAYMLMWSSLCR